MFLFTLTQCMTHTTTLFFGEPWAAEVLVVEEVVEVEVLADLVEVDLVVAEVAEVGKPISISALILSLNGTT
jgi:hypothetical protein